MPRQPYLKVVSQPRGSQIDVGTKSIGQRPALEALIAQCLMTWTHVEAEMALVLGQLLGAQTAVAFAVFQSLRQSRTQREVISAAGKAALNEADQKLLTVILSVHSSLEKERNNIAHGHFGTRSEEHTSELQSRRDLHSFPTRRSSDLSSSK